MKRLLGICAGVCMFGQPAPVPAKWVGTWTLQLQESKFGEIWGPGVPPGGLTYTGQTLKISAAAGRLKVEGDTVTSELGTVHDQSDVTLDGKDTVLGPGLTISFRRVDDATFDIILKANSRTIGNHVAENRFVFATDGSRLTETKTHTEREVVPEGVDQTKSAVIKSSTTVLVFNRSLD